MTPITTKVILFSQKKNDRKKRLIKAPVKFSEMSKRDKIESIKSMYDDIEDRD